MRIDINGNYRIEDLVVLAQHLAVQLEERGVTAIEGVSIVLTALNAGGKRLTLVDDAGTADHLSLEIRDLARPSVGTGALKAIESPTPRRNRSSRPTRHFAPRRHASKS